VNFVSVKLLTGFMLMWSNCTGR